MTDPTPTAPAAGPAATTVLLVCLTVAFGFVMAAVIAVVFAVPEGGNPGSLITILLASFTTLVPTMAALVKIQAVGHRVERTGKAVEYLANGGGDAKIEAAVRRVLEERDESDR